jgi:hypothetical protein
MEGKRRKLKGEGFSTPQPNKRTVGLPNTCPIGLQKCCSILLGSLPLSHIRPTLYRDTRPTAPPLDCHWIASHWDPWPLKCLTPSPDPVLQLTGIPAPHPSPPPFKPCWAPATRGTTGPPSLGLSTYQALPGSSSMWNDWSPALLGQATAWHETVASTSLRGTWPFRWSRPQITTPPGSYLGCH